MKTGPRGKRCVQVHDKDTREETLQRGESVNVCGLMRRHVLVPTLQLHRLQQLRHQFNQRVGLWFLKRTSLDPHP